MVVKCREIHLENNFFRVRENSPNSLICQGKLDIGDVREFEN